MSQDSKELAKHFVVCADAITAFSIAQASAVINAMAYGDYFKMMANIQPIRYIIGSVTLLGRAAVIAALSDAKTAGILHFGCGH